MALLSFSLRKRLQQRAGEPEVYTYDEIPGFLRQQIAIAFDEGIGAYHLYTGNEWATPNEANQIWEQLDRICYKEIRAYTD